MKDGRSRKGNVAKKYTRIWLVIEYGDRKWARGAPTR